MPTNNPNQTTSSQPTPKGATETAAGRIEQGGRRIESTIDKAEKGAEQLASNAIDRVRQAREQATSGIVQQRDQIAHRIHKVSTLLRSGAETLAEDDPLAHSVITYVGERAEGVARYLQEVTPSTVADDLQSFAKRRPGMFFGGAFLIGLAVGRFIKSSTPDLGGGDRADAEGYGETGYEAADTGSSSYGSERGRSAAGAVGSGSTSQSSDYAAPSSGTSLPYVSAGNTIGATPSSSTYGASTSSGTKSGSEGTSPSYGTASVGGTGGYAAPTPSSSGATATRSTQSPALKEAPDEPAKPRAYSVREGEGTKS